VRGHKPPPSLRGAVLALDVDGVVLDPTLGGGGSWHRVLADRYAVDTDRFRQLFFSRYWPDIVVGRTAVEPALAQVIVELEWTMSVDDLLSCWFEADFAVDDDVVEAAKAWAADGVRLVLVTNQEHRRARFLEERLRALMPIDTVAYSAAVGFMKHDPHFFPAASDLLGIDRRARSVVLVDDDRQNIEAARRYGWSAVHFTKGEGWRREITAALTAAASSSPAPRR
jgi:putative hydrolase of the HAD superfamily